LNTDPPDPASPAAIAPVANALPRRTLGKDFRRRFLTALIGAPVALWIVYTGGLPFTLAVLLVAALGAAEFNTLLKLGRLGTLMLEVMTLTCLLGVAMNTYWVIWLALFITLAVGFFESRTVAFAKLQHFQRNWAFLIIGSLYLGLPMACLLLLRQLPDGVWWVGVLFATNWATDGFALIGGRLFGRTKLAPHISPGKTVEGVWTGLVVGVAVGMAVAVPLLRLSPTLALPATALIAILTVIGDLLESWLKRRFKIKDTGTILPGHGGILDRIDGLLLATPGLFLLLLVALR
jgi:phosphatidate cytidylyltransferase